MRTTMETKLVYGLEIILYLMDRFDAVIPGDAGSYFTFFGVLFFPPLLDGME